MSRRRQSGFTLTELILAMAVFSFMLMLVLGVVLLIFQMYSRGNASRDVQQNARQAMETIVRTARLAKAVAIVDDASDDSQKICLRTGNENWQEFYVGTIGGSTAPTILTGASNSSCSATPASSTPIISGSVQVAQLTATKVDNSLIIDLSIASDASLVDDNNQCPDTNQVCAVTSLESSVDMRRFGQ